MPITLSISGMLAAVGEAVVTAVGAAITAISSVVSAPVVIGAAVVAGIALAGYALYESGFFGWLKDVLEDGWNWLKNGFGKVVQKAKSVVQDDIIPGIKNIINSMSKEESLEGKGDEKEDESEEEDVPAQEEKKIDERFKKHIFRDKDGHLTEDTPENRQKIEDTANNPENKLGTDSRGNEWYAEQNADGTQTWAEVRDGTIRNGGVNQNPKTFDPETGLKYNPSK